MKQKKIFSLILMILILTGICFASAVIGPAIIKLNKTGSMGEVTLPHKLHQKALNQDCNACHNMFPKKIGSIQNQILQKELRKKQVMYKLCINCHKKMKKAGKKAGPTSCNSCHH